MRVKLGRLQNIINIDEGLPSEDHCGIYINYNETEQYHAKSNSALEELNKQTEVVVGEQA